VKLIAGLTRSSKQLLFGLIISLLLNFSINPPLIFAESQKQITSLYSDYLKGLYYFENGDFEQALKSFYRAKAKDPDSIHLRLKIAEALVRQDEFEKAEAVLMEAKRIDPTNLDVSLLLIFIYSLTHDDTQLESEYGDFLKTAHELKPKDIGISEYLAQFYFYKQKPQEAIKIYEKILELNPKHVVALFWLGYLYDEAGRRKEAIEVWNKGLAIDEAYAPILNSLAYVYALEDRNLDQAQKMVEKALKVEPENGAYLDSLGWIYFKKGNLEKAKEYLEKAIANIKDPEIYEHLGDLYVALGDLKTAVEYYKEGLSHFPDYTGLKEKIDQYEK